MLESNQIDLWYTDTGQVSESLLPAYRDLLSSSEIDRCDRFVFEEDRRLFLISHCLVRVMLSRYTGISPRELRFITKGQGKPQLAGFGDVPPVQFNLSHTRGMAVLGIAREHDIGVDVEHVKPSTNLEIADRHFSDAEVRVLQQTSPDEQRGLFFRFWTLKESYLKARALGIGFPLHLFTFHLDAHQPPRITFADGLADDPQHWQFFETQLRPDFPSAVAVRQPIDQPATLVVRSVVPLVDEGATP